MKLKHLDTKVGYCVDEMGYLWCGPLPGGPKGLQYLRFEGVNMEMRLQWIWRRKSRPPEACEYTPQQADSIVDFYLYEERQSRRQK